MELDSVNVNKKLKRYHDKKKNATQSYPISDDEDYTVLVS